MNTLINDTLVVIIGVIIAELVYEIGKGLYNNWKYKELRDMECDLCEEPRRLYRTPDKYYYLCKTCMDKYLDNIELNFTDVQKEKIRKKYKINTKLSKKRKQKT